MTYTFAEIAAVAEARGEPNLAAIARQHAANKALRPPIELVESDVAPQDMASEAVGTTPPNTARCPGRPLRGASDSSPPGAPRPSRLEAA